MFGLNKKHLSFSAISLWEESKDKYRQQYYTDAPRFENRYTRFGKEIHIKLETDPTFFPEIDRRGLREYGFDTLVAGVPIHAYVDYIDLRTPKIVDYKTGKTRWTPAKVYAHKQIVLYALLADLEWDVCIKDAEILWFETEDKKTVHKLGGVTLESEPEVRLTGKYEIVKRPYKITKKEKREISDWIARAALEIAEDYATFSQ